MDAPILDFDGQEEIINRDNFFGNRKMPQEKIDYLGNHNIDTCLMFFIQNEDMPQSILDKCEPFFTFLDASNKNWVYIYDNKFLIAQAPVGGPLAAQMMDELGFFGVKNFFACGAAGLIDKSFDSTKFLLIEKAIRDEGSSYHYMPASLYAETDKKLTDFVANFLDAKNFNYSRGISWCTDGFYRETPNRIAKRLSQGATCVDMESATWAAVAKFRKYSFAQLVFFSDIVQQNWRLKDNRKALKIVIVELMLECATKFVESKK